MAHMSDSRRKLSAAEAFTRMRGDTHALNSSVALLSQKMKYLVRNEKILGRNLIVLNKKIKTLEEKIASGAVGASGAGLDSDAIQDLLAKLDEANRRVSELQAEVEELRSSSATAEQLQELRYIIDAINPLEFVTLEQVKEMIGKGGRGKKPK